MSKYDLALICSRVYNELALQSLPCGLNHVCKKQVQKNMKTSTGSDPVTIAKRITPEYSQYRHYLIRYKSDKEEYQLKELSSYIYHRQVRITHRDQTMMCCCDPLDDL